VVSGVVRVAELGESVGFLVAVAEVLVEGDGRGVTLDGVGVVTGAVVGVAEAVPGARFAVPVADLLEGGDGLLAGGQGLVVVAERGVAPADGVEGKRLPPAVAGSPAEGESLLRVLERQPGLPVSLVRVGDSAVDVCLVDQVAGLAVQVEGQALLSRRPSAAQPSTASRTGCSAASQTIASW
jgi:hypothetical protein